MLIDFLSQRRPALRQKQMDHQSGINLSINPTVSRESGENLDVFNEKKAASFVFLTSHLFLKILTIQHVPFSASRWDMPG